jgi:hypothetical protein
MERNIRYFLALGVIFGGCNEPDAGSSGSVITIDQDGSSVDMTVPHLVDGQVVDTRGLDGHTITDVLIGDAAVDMMVPDMGLGCESLQGTLPDGVTVLEYHDGMALSDVPRQTWSVVGQTVTDAVLHESVVFHLDRPARILGYAVQYGTLPEEPESPIAVSLHPDFGHNGFDFWAADPLATSRRCRADVALSDWTEFILPQAVEVSHPGLVHVVHQRAQGGAAWLFDGTPPSDDCGNECCNAFGACHSAWNFPEVTSFVSGGQQNYAYNGVSLSFQYDYMVRLYVEYTDSVTPEETVFAPVPGMSPSNRSAWGDFDNDGDEDLLTNGPRLWRNDDGEFVDITDQVDFQGLGITGSGIFGDYDNDGCLDLFIFDESYSRSDHLLRGSCSGNFRDVTEAAGITDLQDYISCEDGDRAPTPAAAWVDLDGDGFLDLYLANFICWSSGQFYLDTVWRSRGDGTFEEWTGTRGFAGLDDRNAFLASRGVLPADFDGDGDVDILASTYRLNRNLYYRNDGGTFTEQGRESGLAGQPGNSGASIYYGHSIGAAVGDLDGDADLDVVIANLAHPRFYDFSDKSQVFLNQGDGTFQDIQGDWSRPEGAAGLRFQETHSVPTLGDFDNDGRLDLVISAIYDGRPTDFYWGNGDGTFRLDAWRSGLTVTNGWGQASADFDQDGRLDLVTSGVLYRNQRVSDGHWAQTRVVGNVSTNRAGIGATVYLEAAGETYVRVIGGGTGQGCQNSLSPHFGLGAAVQIDRIRVRFVGSAQEVIYEGPHSVDQRIWLYEDGSIQTGWNADW